MGSIKRTTIFLFLSLFINAASAQQLRPPTAQNWAELRSVATSARSSLTSRSQSLQQELERRKKMAKDMPPREGRHPHVRRQRNHALPGYHRCEELPLCYGSLFGGAQKTGRAEPGHSTPRLAPDARGPAIVKESGYIPLGTPIS